MSSSSLSSSRKIILKSSDGEDFEVDESVASVSQTIKQVIEVAEDNTIPLPNVTIKDLKKVMEYCKKRVEAPAEADEVKPLEADFLKALDDMTVLDLMKAANYLNIASLVDHGAKIMAERIKDKSPEEIRIIFGIENDFTPEEERMVRRENDWAFDQ